MGIGPVPAIRAMLEKTGVALKDIDLVEVNILLFFFFGKRKTRFSKVQ